MLFFVSCFIISGHKIIMQIVCPGKDDPRGRQLEGDVKGEDEGGSHRASDHG